MTSVTHNLLEAFAHADDPLPRKRGYRKGSFPRLPADVEQRLNSAQANWFDNATEAEKDASCRDEEVSLEDLHTVQFGVSRAKIASLKAPFDNDVWVDRLGAFLVISDGNHRLESLMRDGQISAKVKVRDLTEWDQPGYK